jgi:hypothetical protein
VPKSKPKEDPPFGPCRLCLVPSVLKNSHIVPQWSYRRIIHGSSDGTMVKLDGDEARLDTEQYAEPLLCWPCEQHVARWDRYAAETSLQRNGKFPAFEAARPVEDVSGPELEVVDLRALETRSLIRFAVSVIWRASVGRLFPKTSLGPYEEDVRRYLQNDHVDLPDTARLLIVMIRPREDLPVDEVLLMPTAQRRDGYYTHRFAIFGFSFNLMVGGLLPSFFDDACAARTGRAVVDDGSIIVRDLAPTMRRVKANGGLIRGRSPRR